MQPDLKLAATLVRELDGASSDRIADLLYETLRPIGLRYAALYLLDYSENALRPLRTRTAPPAPVALFALRGTPEGEALEERRPLRHERDGDPVLSIPVAQRGEAVGVLDLGLEDGASLDDEFALALGVLLGAAVVGARRRFD